MKKMIIAVMFLPLLGIGQETKESYEKKENTYKMAAHMAASTAGICALTGIVWVKNDKAQEALITGALVTGLSYFVFKRLAKVNRKKALQFDGKLTYNF